MSTLPPEIITDILTRVPVKFLLQFKCVSKPWCAQISSPHFSNLHLSKSIATASNLSVVSEIEGSLYSLDYSESNSIGKITKIETPFTDPNKIYLFNSCNGLLLLRTDDVNQWKSDGWMLFNPSTRKYFVLPTPPPHNVYADMGFVYRSNLLGYDVVNDDYKVFNVILIRDKGNKFIAYEARVYSLKSNSWDLHVTKNLGNSVAVNGIWEVYINGALHMIDVNCQSVVVAYDIGNNCIKLIPMPNFKDKTVPVVKTHVFDGCLALLCWYPDNRTDIWVMKEYGVKESWSMLLSKKLNKPGLYVIPVVYSKSRDEVLVSYHCKKFVWYNLRKKTVRDFKVRGLPAEFVPLVCVGSLVSVGSVGKIDEKKQQGKEKVKEGKAKKKRDDFLSKGFKLKL